MPDLLIELFSEEIPARMQGTAREALKKLVTDGLVEAGLTYEGAGAFSTPRRLALTVHGLTVSNAQVAVASEIRMRWFNPVSRRDTGWSRCRRSTARGRAPR